MKFTERTILSSRRFKALAVVAIFLFAINIMATSQTETVLYNLSGETDGVLSNGGLVRDSAGNFYVTTAGGGRNGGGSVFELTTAGTSIVLHSFGAYAGDGRSPTSDLIRDERGTLLGTTQGGGSFGFGTVFRITPVGKEEVLYSFTGGADGGSPQLARLLNVDGYLYGTTGAGGSSTACGGGCGTVFKLAPDGTQTVLHSFNSVPDGRYPLGGLIRDSEGNLYGTTVWGGTYGFGTVFEITAAGTESILYSFTGGSDGSQAYGNLSRGKNGDLFGVTLAGGITRGGCKQGCGVVFQVTPQGVETVLLAFPGGTKGLSPRAGLIRDSKGNFYGTTFQGGDLSCKLFDLPGCGTVFELTATGRQKILHQFAGGSQDGFGPVGGVVLDSEGNLYGTTLDGGTDGAGVVFEVTP